MIHEKEFFTLLAPVIFLGLGSVFDVKSRQLPGIFLYGAAAAAVCCNLLFRYQPFRTSFYGALLGGCFLLLARLTKEAIGYGDGIGIAVTGIFTGGTKLLLLLTLALLLSACYGTAGLLLHKKSSSDAMPFFPFLFLAAVGGIFL